MLIEDTINEQSLLFLFWKLWNWSNSLRSHLCHDVILLISLENHLVRVKSYVHLPCLHLLLSIFHQINQNTLLGDLGVSPYADRIRFVKLIYDRFVQGEGLMFLGSSIVMKIGISKDLMEALNQIDCMMMSVSIEILKLRQKILPNIVKTSDSNWVFCTCSLCKR